MSSHKEAPGLVSDPAADNTDVYAFVSPDLPDTVTLIANFVPLEEPAGGPNFFEFSDDVLYEIHIDNTGDAVPDITYQFRFTTSYTSPDSFLYNTGPIESIDSPNWNRTQSAAVTRVDGSGPGAVSTALATGLLCPPCNVGPASTPNYAALAASAIHTLPTGEVVFTGQRAEGFYVDLGAIFDLGDLRPLQNLHVGSQMPASGGVNGAKAKNVHTIAIQLPKTMLTAGGISPTDYTLPTSVIGVFATASRQTSRMYQSDGTVHPMGLFQQISRLGNPLINEVLIPLGRKNAFNSQAPADDGANIATFVDHPELATLLPVLYPGAFPNLAALTAAGTARADLDAVLLTGIPAGLIPGFQNLSGDGSVKADMLRLNLAIAPTTDGPSNLGLVGGDAAGFPNGRRVFDDVTTIELRAIAGAIYPLVDPTYVPDAAVGAITQGLTSSNADVTAMNTVNYLSVFPYLGTPHSGFQNPADNTPAPDLGAQPVPVPPVGPSTPTTPTTPTPPTQVSIIPVGAPETGGGIASTNDWTRLLTGAGLVAGAAALARQYIGGAAGERTAEPAAAAAAGAGAPDQEQEGP